MACIEYSVTFIFVLGHKVHYHTHNFSSKRMLCTWKVKAKTQKPTLFQALQFFRSSRIKITSFHTLSNVFLKFTST